MRSLSIVTVALLATALCSASPASAGACVQDEYGRVSCGPVLALYPRGWTYGPYYQGPVWPAGYYCPPGTVTGNYQCVPWRAPDGAVKCPPNMWLVDGMCRLYSERW